jgi:Hydrolytic ATP binding site of dynein motor region
LRQIGSCKAIEASCIYTKHLAHSVPAPAPQVEIKLLPTVMAFITMNPGYPGRAELPESLKALFRPVSMVLPDLALICEIMLMAEGFQMSKLLSRKFVILYKLCEDLLSKARACCSCCLRCVLPGMCTVHALAYNVRLTVGLADYVIMYATTAAAAMAAAT